VRGSQVEPLVRRFRKAGRGYARGDDWYEYATSGMGPRYWTLLGPLPSAHQFDQAGIVGLEPVPGEGGWSKEVFFGHDRIDLERHLGEQSDCAVYGYTRFTMARTDSVRFWAGSTDGMTVWIDGQEVYRHVGRRRHHLGTDRVPGYIEAGEHRLLVRADNSRGAFEFSFNICEPIDAEDYAGNRYPGVKYYLVPE
jgi:hypothetical protein